MNDSQLLQLYLADGNQGAISTLVERHRKRVVDYISMMVRNHDVASDITQDTFIKVIQTIDQGRYVDNGKFLSWVLRIAHNKVIDYFRQTKQENWVSESDSGYDILGTKKFSDQTIEEQIEHEQIHEDLRRLVEFLPIEQREVITLRYYDGLSFKEIAEATGVSINTALGRVRYALINLRKLIQENKMVLTVQ